MPAPDLSPEELEILELLAQGNRTSEIAKRLSLSYRAVAETIRDIKTKAGMDINELINQYRTISGSG